MKERFKNYGLWVSLASAVVMLLQAFGLKFDVPYVNEIITGILGFLVACGIISNPSIGTGYTDKKEKEKPNENNDTQKNCEQTTQNIEDAKQENDNQN